MRFYLQRIIKALRARQYWWWLVLVAPLLYLIYAAVLDVRIDHAQHLEYSGDDLPIAASNSPTGIFRLQQLLDHPELLFLDEFALVQLDRKLESLEGLVSLPGQYKLPTLISDTMTLTKQGDTELVVAYQGSEPLLGEILVGFYTDRLLRKASEGMLRTRAAKASDAQFLRLSGELHQSESRSWWRADRLPMAALLLVVSGVSIVLIVIALELTDPSFKSERQMARYLGIPVLGKIPDLDNLAHLMSQQDGVTRESTR